MPESRKSWGSSAGEVAVTVARCTKSLVPGPARRDPPGRKPGDMGRASEPERGTSAKPLSFRSWFTSCPGAVASIKRFIEGERAHSYPRCV